MSFSVSTDEGDKCLPFTLDLKEEIKFITTQNLVELEAMLCDAYIVGIDTETRPSFFNKKTRFAQYPTSIIQIAIRTKSEQEYAMIIDLLSFSNNNVSLSLLNKSLLATMSSSDIVKVGQGLENDLREICNSYPALTAFKDVPSIIDTNKLLRYLQPEIKQDVSLKNLTRNFLHCNLVKTQQCSDWGRRPLSSSQLDYAAGDAVVLLRLFDAMTYEAIDKGSFELIPLLRRFQHGVSTKMVIKVIPESLTLDFIQSIPNKAIITSSHMRFDPIIENSKVPSNYYEGFFNTEESTDMNLEHTDLGDIDDNDGSSTSTLEDDILSKSSSSSSLSSDCSSNIDNDISNGMNISKKSSSHENKFKSNFNGKKRKLNKGIWRPLHTIFDIKKISNTFI